MRRNTFIIIGVIVLVVVAAFFSGYSPEHQRGASLQTDNEALRARFVTLDYLQLTRTTESQYREALHEGLRRRDAITAALATGDPSALEPLRELERRIRQVLATPVSPSVSR